MWAADVGESLSSLTASGGLVFAAVAEQHRVVALDARTGSPKWSFTTGGRVDSPPTIHGGMALFGSADGWVYSVSASDG